MSNDNKTLADVQPGGMVMLATLPYDRARDLLGDAYNAGTHGIGYSQQAMELHDAIIPAQPSSGAQAGALAMVRANLRSISDLASKAGGDRVTIANINCEVTHALQLLDLAARQPVGDQHPDDLAVDAFAAAMKAKMAEARAKGRGGWEDPTQCSADDLTRMLRDHVKKGDPRDVANFCMMLHQRGEAIAARQPVGEPVIDYEDLVDQAKDLIQCGCSVNGAFDWLLEQLTDGEALAAPPAQAVDLGPTFQDGVADWMGQCFLPSLYSNMTERGDRLLEEVLELLQAHGYDRARVPTLVDYVFGRPVGEPAQEVGGVMVTLAGYCWVAGIDMHAAGDAELARINQPDVMAKIRAKQEAKNALHFDTPLPGDPAATDAWPREGDLVRYGEGSSALAIRLEPHAGGWHGYQCCGGYTFFAKAYRPSRADMDTWLDCAKYRDERTKVADSRVAHEMYLIDHQTEVAHD